MTFPWTAQILVTYAIFGPSFFLEYCSRVYQHLMNIWKLCSFSLFTEEFLYTHLSLCLCLQKYRVSSRISQRVTKMLKLCIDMFFKKTYSKYMLQSGSSQAVFFLISKPKNYTMQTKDRIYSGLVMKLERPIIFLE